MTAKDAEGNVIPDATVTLTASGDRQARSRPRSPGTTNAEGVFTTTLPSSTGGRRTTQFTALINGTASETASVDFTAGGVSQATSSLTAVPGTVTADGETTTTLTVTAKDAEGNVIPDATVTLTAADTGDHFWHGVWHHQCGGRVHHDAELDPGERRPTPWTALINGTASEIASVDFTAGGVSQATSSLTAVPGTVTADGETTTTLTVTAKDAEGNVIPDATVTLTSADTGDHFGAVLARPMRRVCSPRR